MPVVVTISLPANGALLQVGTNYQLVGTIQTSSPDGPTPIDILTAQGPGLGPVQLTAQGQGRFSFTAQGRRTSKRTAMLVRTAISQSRWVSRR